MEKGLESQAFLLPGHFHIKNIVHIVFTYIKKVIACLEECDSYL